jgi:hypothetical protein
VTLSGTPTQLNAALLAMTYQGTTNTSGADTLTVTVSDGTTPVTSTAAITITAVNDAPTLTTVSTLTGANEDTAFTISHATLLAAANAADVDVGDTLSYRVEAVTTGTLTTSGSSVVAGTTLLGTGQYLVWRPAANANGTLSAFTI